MSLNKCTVTIIQDPNSIVTQAPSLPQQEPATPRESPNISQQGQTPQTPCSGSNRVGLNSLTPCCHTVRVKLSPVTPSHSGSRQDLTSPASHRNSLQRAPRSNEIPLNGSAPIRWGSYTPHVLYLKVIGIH